MGVLEPLGIVVSGKGGISGFPRGERAVSSAFSDQVESVE